MRPRPLTAPPAVLVGTGHPRRIPCRFGCGDSFAVWEVVNGRRWSWTHRARAHERVYHAGERRGAV